MNVREVCSRKNEREVERALVTKSDGKKQVMRRT